MQSISHMVRRKLLRSGNPWRRYAQDNAKTEFVGEVVRETGQGGKDGEFLGRCTLVIIITGIIGGLTKFQVGKPSHACWLLVWLYGGPAFRWKWLVMHSFDGEPCTSFTRWCVTEVCHALSYLIAAGVYIGMTVILVELFGACCGGPSMTISLSVPWWIVVGGSIFALSAIIGLGISFQQEILGKSNKMMVC